MAEETPDVESLSWSTTDEMAFKGIAEERMTLSRMKKEIEDREKALAMAAMDILDKYATVKAKVVGVGTISIVSGEQKSLSTERLKTSMATHGVPAATIVAVIEESTTLTPYRRAQFYPAKEGGTK